MDTSQQRYSELCILTNKQEARPNISQDMLVDIEIMNVALNTTPWM